MTSASKAAASQPSDHEPLADVLERVQCELEDIARRIDHNQSLIARSTWERGAEDEDYVRAMQDADLSAQRIAGLAGYLNAIAAAAEPQWRIGTAPAAATLTLSRMAARVGGASAAEGAQEEGEVDLF